MKSVGSEIKSYITEYENYQDKTNFKDEAQVKNYENNYDDINQLSDRKET